MIALNSMDDKEILRFASLVPNLQNFTYSTYGGSYGITAAGAVEWKKLCPDLSYIGAYRMNGDVKRVFQKLGVETR